MYFPIVLGNLNRFTSSFSPVLSLECVHINFPTRHNGMNTLQREYCGVAKLRRSQTRAHQGPGPGVSYKHGGTSKNVFGIFN